MAMKSILDVREYLKQFGTIIYVGNRKAELELMEEEVKELYRSQLMDTKDYQMAIFLLRQERQLMEEEK